MSEKTEQAGDPIDEVAVAKSESAMERMIDKWLAGLNAVARGAISHHDKVTLRDLGAEKLRDVSRATALRIQERRIASAGP